jgi:hypothetical protein
LELKEIINLKSNKMKNNVLKYYIVAVYLLSTFVTFAQPGTDDTGSGLENSDAPMAPIDQYVWVLAAIGLVYVFLRVRAFALQVNNLKE